MILTLRYFYNTQKNISMFRKKKAVNLSMFSKVHKSFFIVYVKSTDPYTSPRKLRPLSAYHQQGKTLFKHFTIHLNKFSQYRCDLYPPIEKREHFIYIICFFFFSKFIKFSLYVQ